MHTETNKRKNVKIQGDEYWIEVAIELSIQAIFILWYRVNNWMLTWSELEILGYRNAYRVQEPGTFNQSDNHYRVFLRGFQFRDGSSTPRILDICFANKQLKKVRDVSNQQDVDLIRLEPPRN